MNCEIRYLGKTSVTQTQPWGLFLRNGHRLLCADGVIRAATLAPTADTYFSVPAAIRIKGKPVSGYMAVEESRALGYRVYAFRHHTAHDDKLTAWPQTFTEEHEALLNKAKST